MEEIVKKIYLPNNDLIVLARNGEPFYLSKEDEDLTKYKWRNYTWTKKNGNGCSYIVRSAWDKNGGTHKRKDRSGDKPLKGKAKTLKLHRIIAERMGITKEQPTIDHINKNSLDNRRNNLRPASFSLNNANTNRKGIFWEKSRKKWTAVASYQGKNFRKRFDSYQDAERQRNEWKTYLLANQEQ